MKLKCLLVFDASVGPSEASGCLLIFTSKYCFSIRLMGLKHDLGFACNDYKLACIDEYSSKDVFVLLETPHLQTPSGQDQSS